LFNCLYDADKKPDAAKIFDRLWERSKNKINHEFQETLIRHRIIFAKDNPSSKAQIEKDLANTELFPSEKGMKFLGDLQMMKSGVIPENTVDKTLHSLLYAISPQILTSEETISSTKLNVHLQERLAEASRVAIHFNLISIAEKILNFLQRNRQNSHKTYIWIEYSKAEFLVKKAGNNIDPKTGIRLNQAQMREQEIERRKEALNILEKTMNTSKLRDPDLIYEGCVLIWNIGLPFINENFKEYIVEPFLRACELLEDIQSTDHELRVKLHMELSKIYMQDNHKKKAENHIHKALKLDYSLPEKLIPPSLNPAEDDISHYQRVYDR
jgi:tetratricopeptide (TPR) repeat protein